MSGATKCFFCLSKFGLFKKQYQCSGCGYAACKDCLPHKLKDQSSVCRKCFKEMNNKAAPSGRVSPPANFKREMAEKGILQQQQKASIATMDISQRLEKLKQDMSSPDVSVDELERRVKNLKMSSKQTTRDNDVTFEEIEARLNTLKGRKPPAIRVLSIKRKFDDGNQSCGTSRDNDDGEDQVKRLIRQYTSEVIDMSDSDTSAAVGDLMDIVTKQVRTEQAEADVDDVIGARSRKLLEDLDPESAALVRKLMEEQEIEANAADIIVPTSRTIAAADSTTTTTNDDDEMPWCFMCNDDATKKCMTCEDLYCARCFKEVHNEAGMGGHKTKAYPS